MGVETFRNRSRALKETELYSVKGFSRNAINKIIRKEGELAHHDTITGTSPLAVIF
jgi:hypothetical protein